ncbi:hypothetical protein A2Z00_01590 [Candidatus Gottesmanbacteria bacterium RBG_13_45_10]|uniref:DUF2207 domain-containing protein n=1 Tax=Candidatus Gottesmanbacteria bacterium RBG_13_45_10 TaxID=1798370 RepID=A0A1F5ZGM8_9BACT|nr:MAG: hypothetical protein A2Z00_01590 [Candidatus Gottesmanbacteria bacterium RBG_13_45_10]
MNTIRKLLIIVIFVCCFVFPSIAHAEEILDYSARYTIQKEGSVAVEERIQYDFGVDERHGIYRTIPFIKTNEDNKKYELTFSKFSIVNGEDQPYRFTTSKTSGTISLKIGDANRTITGIHPYVVNYTVSGALTYFSDHDEFYWNVTGNDWQVPISQVKAVVELPQDIPQSSIQVACYTGATGATFSNCNSSLDANNRLTIQTTQPLGAFEGLTIVVGFPKNVVAVLEPKPYVPFWETITGKILLVLIGIGAILWYIGLPIWIITHWLKYGRDPKPATGVASAWFEAPKTQKGRLLTPGETGTLLDEEAGMREVTATIVDLARRGYMKIVEKKKNDFYLVKQKNIEDNNVEKHERTLFNGIFEESQDVRIKDADLISTVSSVKSQLYGAVVSEKFFDKNPESTRTKYYVLAGTAFVTGNMMLAIIAFIFGHAMPRKTLLGTQAAAVARSLKNFLSSQERWLAGIAKNQLMFEKLLPYAIAFGVEKIWAERCKDIVMKDPSWYQGYGSHTFTSMYLLSALTRTQSSFVSAATPTRSSSGFSSGSSGGFSGGGGGGGGGGSW